MATRKISFGTVQNISGGGSVYSDATTWGELKQKEQAIANAAVGMTAIVGGSGGTKLTSDSQPLPTGDFQIFFVLEKNSSGQ